MAYHVPECASPPHLKQIGLETNDDAHQEKRSWKSWPFDRLARQIPCEAGNSESPALSLSKVLVSWFNNNRLTKGLLSICSHALYIYENESVK